MPTTQQIAVKSLSLDLKNFRMVEQADEESAVRAMISIQPERFWALMDSLLEEDGYLPTESVIVLQGKKKGDLTVKEGNRRVAALKLVLGLLTIEGVEIPNHTAAKIASLTKQWKDENKVVPCTIYEADDAKKVDRIVTLTHGKAQQAGRDQWTAVARARHNRVSNPKSEPGLDLLEKYLATGRNLDAEQKERWGGDYNLSVLDEMLKRYSKRFGSNTPQEMADSYPKVKNKRALDDVLRDIGLEQYGFKHVRDTKGDPLFASYKVPPLAASATTAANAAGASAATGSGSGGATATTSGKPGTAKATNDPMSVASLLKNFQPKGKNRDKVVTLLNEAKSLKLTTQPHAFCFVLRSMFEISAKAFCADHSAEGLSSTNSSNQDRPLVDVLRDITEYLTKDASGKPDKAKQKKYHGPMTELARQVGFLSVTSMNQLVHNPKFTVDDSHISTLFGNIFPLLEAMNS